MFSFFGIEPLLFVAIGIFFGVGTALFSFLVFAVVIKAILAEESPPGAALAVMFLKLPLIILLLFGLSSLVPEALLIFLIAFLGTLGALTYRQVRIARKLLDDEDE